VIVLLAHAPSVPFAFLTVAAVAATTILLVAMRHGLSRPHANAIGASAAGTAIVLAGWSVASVALFGIAQPHPGTHHPNLAAAIGMALAGAASLTWREGRRGAVAASAGVIAGILVVLSSGSRSGVVGLAVAVSAVLALTIVRRWTRGVRRPGRVAALIVVAAGAGLGLLQAAAFDPAAFGLPRSAGAVSLSGTTVDPAAGESLPSRLSSLADPWRAAGARIANWRVARQIAGDRPFLGYGFDAAIDVYRSATEQSLMVTNAHPHNSLLLALLQGGTVFVTALAYGVVTIAWRLTRRAVVGDGAATIVASVSIGVLAADRFDLLLANATIAALLVVSAFAVLARPWRAEPGARRGTAPERSSES
jgi:O-antigen ligase